MPRYNLINLILSTQLWWLVKVPHFSWLATESRYWNLIGQGCPDKMLIVDTLSGCPPVLLQMSSICLPLSLSLFIDDVLARVLIYLLYFELASDWSRQITWPELWPLIGWPSQASQPLGSRTLNLRILIRVIRRDNFLQRKDYLNFAMQFSYILLKYVVVLKIQFVL